MERMDFSAHRVLLVGAKTHAVQLLRSVLGIAGVGKIIHVQASHQALDLLGQEHFNAVFCDHKVSQAGEKSFVRAVRRQEAMLNPMVPIFMLQERARRRDVEKARDAGATDMLTLPISAKTLLSKLFAATHAPRPFIVSPEFFGPDRRAKARPGYCGADRRKRIPKKARVDFTPV